MRITSDGPRCWWTSAIKKADLRQTSHPDCRFWPDTPSERGGTGALHPRAAKCGHWGKYRSFVVDRDDPEQLGRLKPNVPSVLGDAVTGWAWPALPYAGANLGFFFVPQNGDLVWVEFVEGELEHPLWSGGGWGKPGGTAEIPDEAKDNYPDTQVLRTKSGHVIILDDKDGQEQITIRDKAGSSITLKQDGTVSIQSRGQPGSWPMWKRRHHHEGQQHHGDRGHGDGVK